MANEYTCPICGAKISQDMIQLMKHVKPELLEIVRKENPNWTPEQGICPSCKGHCESWFDKV